MRFLLFLAVAIALGCQTGDAAHPGRSDRPAVPVVPPARAELLAYHDGRSSEIAALRQRPALSGGSLDSIGAAAAGLSVEAYRRVTAAVDAYLKEALRMSAGAGVPPAPDPWLAQLDSLRVERLVLGVRRGG